MTDYNVFNNKLGDWHRGEVHTYITARLALEDLRAAGFTDYEVREIPHGTEAVGYNVWVKDGMNGRWTRNNQDPKNPLPLTFLQAVVWMSDVSNSFDPAIMEIGSDLKPQPIFGKPEYQPSTPATVVIQTPPVVEETTPEIDWAAYNGFKGTRVYRMRDLQQDIDPYTGLRREK